MRGEELADQWTGKGYRKETAPSTTTNVPTNDNALYHLKDFSCR